MDIQFPQILFQAINFLVVTGGLTYLLYKPIIKLFADRAQRIAEGQEAAELALKQREEVDQLAKRTQEKLDKKSAEVMEKATHEADAEKDAIIKAAQVQAVKQLDELGAKWQTEKTRLVEELHGQLADTVIEITGKLVKTNLVSGGQKKLIDQELKTILAKI